MSYILEALKKAQAERQLGNAPTIHAAPLHAAEPEGGGAGAKPLVIGLALLALGASGAAVYAWKQSTPPATPLVQAAAPAAAAPAATAPAAAAPAVEAPAAPVPVPLAPPPAALPVVQTPPAPAPRAEPLQLPEVKPAKKEELVKKDIPLKKEEPLKKAEPAKAEIAKAVAAVAAPEEALRTLRELPDALQHEIPPIAVGGYIYSRNPADRLLLIDKVLRREGEEVAPGLVLEKLLPKSAVMSYKGQRYRHPY